ncbi:MAG: HAD family hydrolase [Phycisphaerales bacterium]|nr:MAG: HAD family hydrolase [Phycisphaerales bacterium]
MTFLIELDGVILDLRPVQYRVYRGVAASVGWSRLDEATFWRLTRTRGRQADLLPGARPAKVEAFFTAFDEHMEKDDAVESLEPHPEIRQQLKILLKQGRCRLLSLGSNIPARQRLLDRLSLGDDFGHIRRLAHDPRQRPNDLRTLADGDPRTIVVAAADSIIRAAGQAELLAVGISSGSVAGARLHRAGADLVFTDLSGLTSSLQSGAGDLVRAGLLPPTTI